MPDVAKLTPRQSPFSVSFFLSSCPSTIRPAPPHPLPPRGSRRSSRQAPHPRRSPRPPLAVSRTVEVSAHRSLTDKRERGGRYTRARDAHSRERTHVYASVHEAPPPRHRRYYYYYDSQSELAAAAHCATGESYSSQIVRAHRRFVTSVFPSTLGTTTRQKKVREKRWNRTHKGTP